MKAILILFLVFVTLDSHAFLASIYGDPVQNYSTRRPTHFVISAHGFELGTLPLEAAVTKAIFIKRAFPEDQVVIISNYETLPLPEKANKNFKLESDIVFYPRASGTSEQFISTHSLISYLGQFDKIKSIHIYGHSSVQVGFFLSPSYILGDHIPGTYSYASQLKGHFTKDAFAILYGCNSGWKLAVKLSEVWGIPVAGSFTGTTFERLGEDRKFYPEDAIGVKFLESNHGSSCKRGGCLRLVPQNGPYQGHWGAYTAPSLAFFKFFCRKQDSANASGAELENCYHSMAISMLSTVHPFEAGIFKEGTVDDEIYKKVVIDFLCANDWRGNKEKCEQFLRSYRQDLPLKDFNRSSFFMLGNWKQLDADFNGYNYDVSCGPVELKGQCSFRARNDQGRNAKVDTLVREYEAYIRGLQLIKSTK